jgi:membrane-associated HD superfamily phosphohydrolase
MDKTMIAAGHWDNFLTLEDERLLLVKRRHPLVVILPILLIAVLAAIFISCAFLLFSLILPSIPLFIITLLLIASVFLTLVTKCIMDWYFHLYILTSRKMLEVWYTPLYSHVMNDVLLDRVNCTQIDFNRNGFIKEMFDMGDIVITFDRPTHQEEFILKDVEQCYKLGVFLTQKLLDQVNRNANMVQPIWFKEHRSQET